MGKFVSTYNPELALAVCERIAEGETLSAITVEKGMPTRQTFHRWTLQFPELSRAYSAAREVSAHSLEEEALDIARELKKDRKALSAAAIRALDVAMNQLRWSASRRNPRVYSERGAVQVTVPIQINTTLDLAGGGPVDNIYNLKADLVIPQEPEQVDHGAEMQKETKALVPFDPRRQRMEEAKAKHGEPWKQYRDRRTVEKYKALEEAGDKKDAGEAAV